MAVEQFGAFNSYVTRTGRMPGPGASRTAMWIADIATGSLCVLRGPLRTAGDVTGARREGVLSNTRVCQPFSGSESGVRSSGVRSFLQASAGGEMPVMALHPAEPCVTSVRQVIPFAVCRLWARIMMKARWLDGRNRLFMPPRHSADLYVRDPESGQAPALPGDSLFVIQQETSICRSNRLFSRLCRLSVPACSMLPQRRQPLSVAVRADCMGQSRERLNGRFRRKRGG